MPEKKTNSESKMSTSNKCSCCPYGFHIDRDFVRYCDSLYNSTQLDKLRQNKREKRKETKTVESYLGLGNISALNTTEQKLFKVLQDVDTLPKKSATLPHSPASLPHNSSTLPHNSSTLPHNFANDGLENAMQDFEDTWQKSLRRSCSSSEIILTKRNGVKPLFCKPTGASPEDRKELPTLDCHVRSRNSSTSSVSSQSTVFSSTSLPVTSDIYHDQHSFDIMTTSMDSSVSKARVMSPCLSSGINRTILSSIRERMATSLLRMKELEEQVKTIPVLEVKLYALAEEKKSLINQLKCKQQSSTVEKSPESQHHLESQLKRLENEGIMSPTLTRKCLLSKSRENTLSSPAMVASSLDKSISKRNFILKETVSHIKLSDLQNKPSESPIITKNAATSCSVLTRDIGIGYVPNKFKSVAVGSDITFQDLIQTYTSKKGFDQFTSVSSESLESDSESLGGSDEQSRSFLRSRLRKTLPSSYKTSNIPIKTLNSSTNTTIKYYLNKYVNTDELPSKSPVIKPSEKLFFNKSSMAVPSLSSKSVQTFEKKTFISVGLQTMHEVKPIEKRNSQLLNEKRVIKCDVGIGDFNVSDIHCAACNKVKRSVGVGDFSIKSVVCDQCSSFWPRSKPTMHNNGNCENCVLRQTETVGVGDYDVNYVDCQNCENVKSENLEKLKSNSVATNTILDSSSSLSVSKSDMHICDKCSATIQSVAQGFAANTTDSKIPRPNLKISVSGKTNHIKLAKLRTQVIKTQKTTESTMVDAVSISSIEKQGGKIQATKSAISKLNIEYKKVTTKDGNNSKDSPQLSGSSTVLPDFTNLPSLPHKKVELSKEVKAACKVLNDYLQKPDRGGEKKTLSSLTIIQNEWFRVANQKKADPLLIEDYLDTFEDFSKLLLNRVVNLSDNNGNTALHYAISYGNFDVLSILIDSKVCDVNKKNKAGYTSIMLVALADMKNDAHHYVVQRLFSIGDINSKATQNGQTALMLAVSHGKRDIVKILLDTGAEVNLQDKDGSTALMCAAEHGYLEIVRMLLSHPECDPTIVDNDECNALTIAMEAGHKDIGLLIYTNMNFSRGSSPYSTLKTRKRSTPRSTPPPRTPTLRTPPLPSPSARSTNSIPSSFQFPG